MAVNDKEYQVKDMTILEDDLKTQKKYKSTGEAFVIKYPFPQDRKTIARRIAAEFNGLPMDSFSYADRTVIMRDAEIDALVEGPESWKGADNCLDEDLKNWLYEECKNWQTEFQEKLKKNKFAKRSKKTEVPD